MFTVKQAADLCEGQVTNGAEVTISDTANVVIDSRRVTPGDLFVALHGPNHDGHAFLPQVIKAGAAAVLVADVESLTALPSGTGMILAPDTEVALQQLARGYRAGFDIPVAAITGSCGKTTTKEMVRAILQGPGNALLTEGNLNNYLGLPLTLLKLRPRHQRAVVEMGINHTGEMDRLTRIANPTVGLITGIGDAHLEGLSDRQGVADEKGRLFAHVAGSGMAVVNVDDPQVVAQAKHYGVKNSVTYSVREDTAADVSVAVLGTGESGADIRLTFDGQAVDGRLFSAAPHQLQNAAAAAALAYALEIDPETIATGLAGFTPPAMRGREFATAAGARVIDDTYNANPDSTLAAVTALMQTPTTGRRMAALGDMLELGEKAQEIHHEVGEQVARLGPDRLVCVGDLSRSMAKGAAALADVQTATDAKEASVSLNDLGPGDLVLIKGSRGMKMEELVSALVPTAYDGAEVHA